MAHRVKLYLLGKTPRGWKRYPAAMGKNGKVRPGRAVVNGVQQLFATYRYQLRHWDGSKMVWRNTELDAAQAAADAKQLSRRLAAKTAAVAAGTSIPEESPRIALTLSAERFAERQAARGKERSVEVFWPAADDFLTAVGVHYADELTEQHILRWYASLREAGNSDRTIYNKHCTVMGWLKWAGVDTRKLAAKAPTYTQAIPKAYKRDELSTFFASLENPYHRIVFSVLLKTGLRMQEAMHMRWTDIDWGRKLLTVAARDREGETIKDRAERKVPIPNDLLAELKRWRKVRPQAKLVLGTANDTPNWKWLPLLKRLARKAKLNCGHCAGCKSTGECSAWILHRFRATYTTMMLRALNGDARTVMQYTGHEDLATVMRYLEPDETARNKINAIQWGD